MKKIIRKSLIIFMVFYAVFSFIPFTFAGNVTNSSGKGTVTGSGTEEDPYKLVLGEPIIDIYYAKPGDSDEAAERRIPIYFEFTGGSCNAANYLVDHNADKHRLRFTLMGSKDAHLRVSSVDGLNYIQAGAECFAPDYQEESVRTEEENGDIKELEVQTPFYNITVEETVGAKLSRYKEKYNRRTLQTSYELDSTAQVEVTRGVDLGNGYLVSNNIMASNVSTYATSYVFAKSNIDYTEAYKLSSDQLANMSKIILSYQDIGSAKFYDGKSNTITANTKANRRTGQNATKDIYEFSGAVRIVYAYEGTNSRTLDAAGEEAGAIEKVLSKIFTAIGDVFVKISGLGGWNGENYITIDSLVFNEYPHTIVNFWGDTGYTNAKAKSIIEFWFNIFKSFAIVVYIILLIYIGIKVTLVAGTSEQKKAKEMLEGWIQGLLLLFFLPFLFKYLISINDMIVDVLRVNSKYSAYAYYTFETVYEETGGQEDGEDSTTTVLEKLRDLKANLKAEIKTKNDIIGGMTDVLEGLKQDQADAIKKMQEGESAAELEKESINYILKKYKYKLVDKETHQEVNINAIEQELSSEIDSFYEANKDELIENEEYGYGEIYDIVYDIGDRYTFINSAGEEIGRADIGIKALGKALVEYHTNEILIAIYQNDIEAQQASAEKDMEDLAKIENAIAMAESNDVDVMGEMRRLAGSSSRFFYVVLWFILIFEVILLLIIYYKRLFMLMILIAVFPLVTIAYVYERTKEGSPTILKNWMKEYTLNVFIQTIHALLYVTLVEAGYTVFLADNDSWVIFLMAVTAMITIEPVFKNILGMKGSTVTDLIKYSGSAARLTAAGAAVFGTIKNTGKDLEKIDKASQNKEAAVQKKYDKKDSRENIKRKDKENKINQKDKWDDKKKEEKLEKERKANERKDKRKEWTRKQAANRRMHQRRLRKAGRIAANSFSAFGAVAGGLAAGGEMDDFVGAAGIAKAVTGTGSGSVSLSADAKKAEKAEKEKNNVNVENSVGDVSVDNSATQNVGYSGPGYDDYSLGGRGSAEDVDSDNPIQEETPKMKPKLRALFTQRLEEEKIFVDTNYHIREEDEKK